MESGSRKRPASALSDRHTSAAKKSTNPCAEPDEAGKPTLVTLPYEVRLLILRELLQVPSLLRYCPNLYPAILRTCKTFAEDHEKEPLLYKNNFELRLKIDRHGDEVITFLDMYDISSPLFSLPKALLRKVQKITITVAIYIGFGQSTGPLTRADSFEYRSSVADLVKPLEKFRALQDLTIALYNPLFLAEDNPLGNDIFHGLRQLRGLKCVTITGASSVANAAEVKTVMECNGPAENLRKMVDALRKYLGEEYADDEDWGDIRYALSTYDVESFKRTRQRIVERTEAARTAVRLRLYRYDHNAVHQPVSEVDDARHIE